MDGIFTAPGPSRRRARTGRDGGCGDLGGGISGEISHDFLAAGRDDKPLFQAHKPHHRCRGWDSSPVSGKAEKSPVMGPRSCARRGGEFGPRNGRPIRLRLDFHGLQPVVVEGFGSMIDDFNLVDKIIRYRVRHSGNAGDSWGEVGLFGCLVQGRSRGETVFRTFLTGFRAEVFAPIPQVLIGSRDATFRKPGRNLDGRAFGAGGFRPFCRAVWRPKSLDPMILLLDDAGILVRQASRLPDCRQASRLLHDKPSSLMIAARSWVACYGRSMTGTRAHPMLAGTKSHRKPPADVPHHPGLMSRHVCFAAGRSRGAGVPPAELQTGGTSAPHLAILALEVK